MFRVVAVIVFNQFNSSLVNKYEILHYQRKQEEEFIYCPYRGVKLEAAVPSYRLLSSGDNVSVREAIANYFHSGFEYEAILGFLSKCHGTQVAQAKLAYVIRSQVNLHTLRNLHVI